jgi:glucosamine-6-phosphate isomerase
MEIIRFKHNEMDLYITDKITACVDNKPDALLCLAAGHTSLGVFLEMIKRQSENKINFKNCRFVSLDEWAGLGRGDDGSMIDFMYKYLFSPLGIVEEHITFFNGKADLQNECTRVDKYLGTFGPVDFMLLGVGMNGHLGLNEPGSSFVSHCHVVELERSTQVTAQKYFKNKTDLSFGITMGMQNIKDAKQVFSMIMGRHKANITRLILDTAPTSALPATFLKTLDQAVMCYEDY